jgi:hypothetical protein
MIYAPGRRVTPETVATYIENAAKLVAALPDFILGFDLVCILGTKISAEKF